MSIKRCKKFILAGAIAVIAAALIIAIASVPKIAQAKQASEPKRAVPFSEVNVNEGFMHNYIKLVICKVIPTAIEQVESFDIDKDECGGVYNIENCAKWHKNGSVPEQKPKHLGARYVDSDVHKVLESMCMALDTPDDGDQDIIDAQTEIASKLEKWIEFYQWAPEQADSEYPGYFDSFYSLDPSYIKYSNTDNHELYCQGHFIEAAVAHYRYQLHKNPSKPDDRLLKVALNSADHIVKTFGEDATQRHQIPGHEEIELALIKLAKLYKEINPDDPEQKAQGYIDTAAYFLEMRGHDWDKRTVHDVILGKLEYDQDHKPVSEQMEAVGHAVRAQYLYTGMCELATIDPNYANKYKTALQALWDDLTHKKQYITGGVGDSSGHNEGFSEAYYLPNYLSYCETCAGVANMLWNRSMSILYDGSQYAEQIETDLYNNILGCVNFDGNKFYYENRICTTKAFDRKAWYGTACCPPNFTRTILQVGGYIYNTTSNAIYVNQYITNNATFSFGEHNNTNVKISSNLPYGHNGEITITPETSGAFDVYLRMPNWASAATIKVGGEVVSPTVQDGYLVISGRTWSSTGTKIEFDFDMPLKYETTDSRVVANQGLVALRHGPLFYCAEECDHPNFEYIKASIDQNGTSNFEEVKPLDGMKDDYGVCSVSVLNHAGKLITSEGTQDITWRLIPYYARCNRTLGGMHLFFHDGKQEIKTHQRATALASFTSTTPHDFTGGMNDGSSDPDVRWTSYNGDNVIQNPWVEYDFDRPVCFNGFRIWWYDDNGGVRTPDGFTFDVYKKQNGEEVVASVSSKDVVSVSNEGNFTTYMFPEAYEGELIRMTLQNEVSAHAAGIVEWELVDANPTPVDPGNATGTPQTGDSGLFAILAILILAVLYAATKKFGGEIKRLKL